MFDPEVDHSDVGGSDPIRGVIFLTNCGFVESGHNWASAQITRSFNSANSG